MTLIIAVVFTTIALQSCRQSDDFLSPTEAATLKRVQDSSSNSLQKNTTNVNTDQNNSANFVEDGEILPPPRK
ncbi:hypothetical protein [Kaistella sp.]|uniref:hypothetical protein n=1 Tax=Kaistella sp. TaxID=2782235 RepID=UPI003C53DE09